MILPRQRGALRSTDGTSDKYLNYGKVNSGFIITPAARPSTVTSFQITTANDIANRDPSAWSLYGTNDAITSCGR